MMFPIKRVFFLFEINGSNLPLFFPSSAESKLYNASFLWYSNGSSVFVCLTLVSNKL